MSPELDKSLCEKYPLIFRDRNGSVMETLMCWGFDHGDGWYNLIDKMCYRIQSHINSTGAPQVIAVQVKEKFGRLNFYYDGGDEFIRGVVRMAEAMSEVTCMSCGKPGELIAKGWWHVACDEHKVKND